MNPQVLQSADMVKQLLGDHLCGMYLYGSAMLGGLKPQSDLDLLVLTDVPLTQTVRREMTLRLLGISGRIGEREKRPIELTVVNIHDVNPWQFPPNCEYMYGEWIRESMEAGNWPQAWLNPDLVILLWQVQQHCRALYGPEATSLLPQIDFEEIRKATARSLPELLAELRGDERNVLLTLARMWYTLFTGSLASKDEAAAWALKRISQPLCVPLETARRAYLGEAADDWSVMGMQTEQLAAELVHKIRALLP